jgi:hypothetical protein
MRKTSKIKLMKLENLEAILLKKAEKLFGNIDDEIEKSFK